MSTEPRTIVEPLRHSVQGIFSAKQMVEVDGRIVPLSDPSVAHIRNGIRERALRETGIRVADVVKRNLVVNVGRLMMCRQLAGDVDTKIESVQFGDCKVNGLVSKDLFPPDLSDNALVSELRTNGGAPGGTFLLDDYVFPAQVTKSDPPGLPGTLVAGSVSRLVDGTADFTADGVTDDDVVTVILGGEDYTLAVRRVIGPTELEVENPGQLAGAGLSYSVTTPQGQVLFRKFVSGNNFPTSLYGPMTVAHEAGLLFSNGAIFNRVIFAPASQDVGLVFQPQDINGVTLGVQVDWLIVI